MKRPVNSRDPGFSWASVGTFHRIEIQSLAYNGYGVGRVDGKVFFVPFTAPGDEVECRVVRTKKNCFFAEVTRFFRYSSQRREPLCPVFGICGGCQWQHLTYRSQLQWKETIFGDMLQRQARISCHIPVSIIPSPMEFHYRNRAQFKCRRTEQGLAMGFYRRESHFVVDIDECPLMAPEINEAFRLFRLWLEPFPHRSQIPQIDISVDDAGDVRAVVHFLADTRAALAEVLRPMAEKANYSLFFQSGRNHTLRKICGRDNLSFSPLESPEKMSLVSGPGSFSQVNALQNRRLVSEVVSAADLSGIESVLDLYCGIGNLSLPLAAQAAQIVGVESYAPAIRQAAINARQNNLSNACFHVAAAEEWIREACSGKRFDLILLDPPREGAYQTVKKMVKLGTERIIYVSCNPATLARDLVPLLNNGYRIGRIRLFDFFPQTFHIESMTLLERKEPSSA